MPNEFKVKNGLIVDQGGASITGSSLISGSLSVSSGITGSLFGSASYAFTASYALNSGGASIDTGSFAITGSNRFAGNQIITGSLITSGSNTLIGNTSLTGSLNVSGSTTQVGNNTLQGNTLLSGSIGTVGNSTLTGSFLVSGSTTQVGNNTLQGNTLLSGSITISGSYPVGSYISSVNIYGDTTMTGYLKFNPQSTNIDTTISASYIFVSGSTNDLYFSQNTKGYSNITRLRWIEGNLFTGLLNGALITTQSSTVYQVSSGSGIVVSLNTSISDNPYPTITYLNWPNLSASIAPLSASYDQSFIAIYPSGSGNTPAILAQGTPFNDGQFDTAISVGLVLHSNHSSINGWKSQPAVAYGAIQKNNIFTRAFGPLKLSGFPLAVSGSSTGSLIIGSGTAYAEGSYYAIDTNNPSYVIDSGTNISKIWRYRNTSSYTEWIYDTNNGAGYGAIDPTRYSNNGVLTAVPGGGANRQWSIQRVYWFPNSNSKAIIVYYGNATYLSELDAIANVSAETFVEAPNTAANAIYVGSVIVRNNADFTSVDSYKIIPGGLFRNIGGSGGGGSVITQTLAGLSDVNITGPTNGQPLVYNNVTAKWENQSTLTATLVGNSSTATSASYASTASVAPAYVLNSSTSSMLAPYVLSTSTGSFIANSQTSSMSVLSASYAATAALAPNYVLNSVTASMLLPYVLTSSTSSMSVLSASFASTASSAENFTVRGTLTAQTIVVQTITSSTDFVTGSTRFGSLQSNTHQFTGSVSITGSLNVVGSISGNLTGSVLGTSSWSQNSVTASFAPSYVLNTATSSFVLNSQTSSFVTNSQTGSFATTGSNRFIGDQTITGSLILSSSAVVELTVIGNQINTGSLTVTGGITGSLLGSSSFSSTASYVLNAISSSFASTASLAPNYVLNSSTASFVTNSQTSSFITNSQTASMSVLSSSYATTSSLPLRGLITASVAGSTITFTKGDSTTFDLTIAQSGTVSTASYVTSSGVYGPYGANSILSSSYAATTSLAPNYVLNSSTSSFIISSQTGSFITNSQTSSMSVLSASFAATASLAPSYVLNSSTSSFVTNSQTGSFITNSQTSSMSVATASYVLNAISSSYAATASSVNVLNQNVQISGSVSIIGSLTVSGSISGLLIGTSSWANNSSTASYVLNSVSSSYAATAALAPNYVLNSSTSSMLLPYVLTSVTSSMLSPYVLSTNTASFVTNSQTSSFVTNSQTSSMTVLSASFAGTASSAENFTVRGTLTAQTIVAQTITASTEWVTGSSKFGSVITNTHQFTGSLFISGSTTQTGSFIINNNAGTVTSFNGDPFTFARIGNTLSFFAASGGVGNDSVLYSSTTLRLGGGSNAAQIVLDSSGNKVGINKASPNAALDVNGNVIITGSLILSSSAAIELTIIGNQTNTGSLIVTQGITGSLQGTSSWANNSITASYVTASNVIGRVLSSSYAISASYAPNMGSSAITIADEGTVQGTVTFINFIGSAVTATVSSNTGSITITGGSGGGLLTKAGAVTNTSFTGTPRTATVTFSAAFPNTSYGIVVTGADLRSWTIESKVAGSFIINTNSNAALTGDTYWVATAYGETA